jgi:hypothetical protein
MVELCLLEFHDLLKACESLLFDGILLVPFLNAQLLIQGCFTAAITVHKTKLLAPLLDAGNLGFIDLIVLVDARLVAVLVISQSFSTLYTFTLRSFQEHE